MTQQKFSIVIGYLDYKSVNIRRLSAYRRYPPLLLTIPASEYILYRLAAYTLTYVKIMHRKVFCCIIIH